MRVEVHDNPNCAGPGEVIFCEQGAPRPVAAIRAEWRGKDAVCDLTGVDEGGRWVPARACKVEDSGEGTAFLIYGGAWGIRMRPRHFAGESWDLADDRQWGEPHKVYGAEDDIFYS